MVPEAGQRGGAVKPLYALAFDHRSSFARDFLGVQGELSGELEEWIRRAKAVALQGVVAALGQGVPREQACILVDEEYGAAVARQARAEGIQLAMAVEKSGRQELELEYGDQFGSHIDAFDPTFVKVLVRYNPDGDQEMNRRQRAILWRLQDWLDKRRRQLMFELLVPAQPAQLERARGDKARFDRELRPGLVVRAIGELQAAGIDPVLWKIEGLESEASCQRVAASACAGGRQAGCLVLGRGADAAAVERWLRLAAPVNGFDGFAVGRTLWWDALKEYFAGGDAERAAAAIASNYRRMVEVYQSAAADRTAQARRPEADSASPGT